MTITVVSGPGSLGGSVSAGVFLAGPDAPDPATSWRAEAVTAFTLKGFAGEIYAPDPTAERESWRAEALEVADLVLFWFPDGATSVHGTVALDLARSIAEGRALIGTDGPAPADDELLAVAARSGLEVHHTIDDLVDAALRLLGPPALRHGPDRFVPLPVWRSASFQSWRRGLDEAGHRTTDLRILWRWPMRAGRAPFAWVAGPQIEIAGEDRAKTNEIVIGRPDTASVCAWGRGDDGRQEVVLVREFRSPAGHLLELPGGSVEDSPEPLQAAVTEFAEEVGMTVERSRLLAHGVRRSVATLSSHTDHLFSVELTADELDVLRADAGTHGVGEHERTTVAVVAVADLDRLPNIDWATVGRIRQVLDSVDRTDRPSSTLPVGPQGPRAGVEGNPPGRDVNRR